MTSSMSDEKAVRAALDRAVEIMITGDIDAVGEIWADDVIVMLPGHPAIVGKEDVVGWYEDFLDTYALEYHEFLVEELEVLGDSAFDRVENTGRMIPRDCDSCCEPIAFDNKAIHLWSRQPDGSWRISRAIFNRND